MRHSVPRGGEDDRQDDRTGIRRPAPRRNPGRRSRHAGERPVTARRRFLALAAALAASTRALVLNARTARALGIALPKPVLLIADEVIE